MPLGSFALCLLLQSPPAVTPPVPAPPAVTPAEAAKPADAKAPQPADAKPAEAAQPPAATKPGERSPVDLPDIPGAKSLAPEKHTRVYIVIDRVSTAAGTIEREDDSDISIRDPKGRVRSFAKTRVMSINYLLDGPPGRRVRATFTDGRTLIGELIEDGFEALAIDIKGVPAKFPRDSVVAVLPYPTDQELYRRFRDAVEPDQYGARYTLSLWLYQRKMYDEAKLELESLLDATNHFEASQLLREVNAQIELQRYKAPSPSERAEDPARAARTPDPKTGMLTAAEVNLIRVYEIDVSKPPRLQVPKSLITTLLERYSTSDLIPTKPAERNAFYSKEPIEIVKTLFALKARDLYGEVKVLSEPDSLNLFRQRVHNTWVINNCATSRCHGGPDGGRLFLFNKNHKESDVRTTNMLILARTSIDGLPLVDFDKPTDSLAFQYALPKTEARRPHPDVKGWEPAFLQGRKGLEEDFVDWVRSMKIQRGEYPTIDYVPPGMRRVERPSPGGPDR